MNETVTQRLLAMPEPCTSQQQGVLKLTEMLATHLLKFPPLEHIPDAFLRIERGRRGRQTFQMNSLPSGGSAPMAEMWSRVNGTRRTG